MLRSLAEFQTRAEQKDPIKAKQKLRYIVGMKQVMHTSDYSKDAKFDITFQIFRLLMVLSRAAQN
jgi:hypothetical protein